MTNVQKINCPLKISSTNLTKSTKIEGKLREGVEEMEGERVSERETGNECKNKNNER